MSVNDSVNRIVTGSGVILAGTFIGMLLDIITKKVLTSHLAPADFGTYAPVLTVISITGAVATLGLNEGVPRYIAFFRGRHEEQKCTRSDNFSHASWLNRRFAFNSSFAFSVSEAGRKWV